MAQAGGNIPVIILKEGTGRSTGRDAQRNNIMAAKVIAETVASSLGPRGMDKMLVSGIGDIVITNDGATIMKELDIQHPAAKMLVEVAKTQDNEVGDGTTSAVILAGQLLSKAEKLLDLDVHPTIIVDGYKKAADSASKFLDKIALAVDSKDEVRLRQVAATSMATKDIAAEKEFFAKLVVKAVGEIMEERDGKVKADIDLIKVVKKHGKSVEETELVEGVVIDKEISHSQMPKQIHKAKIALLNQKLEIEKTEFDAKINIENPEQMHMFLDEEERMLKEMADQIAGSGANVIFCEKGIDDIALHFLAKKGILAAKNLSSGDMEKLAKATGGKILASTKDMAAEALGEAKLVEEVKIGDDKLIFVRECKDPRAVTIVLRGGSEHVVDEAERSLHDGLCVVRNVVEDGKIVAGGGASEAEAAKELKSYAKTVGGREQLGIEAFAEAFESIPMGLAANAGLDPIDIMVDLRAKHEKPENMWMGVDAVSGKVEDMLKQNVVEPLRTKLQVIRSATEAACMILRIDDVVSSKGTAGGPPGGRPPGMPGGMPPGGGEEF